VDREGREVCFWNKTQKIDAPAGLGWLRASHHELDPARSVPGRPYHTHQRRQWLRPSDIVEVEVEIWPTSTVWQEGETLRLVVQGTSFDDQ
jgi:predicted acyl esterase